MAASAGRLEIDHFALISFGCYGEYIVVAVLHAVAHVVHDAVLKEVFLEDVVLVGGSAELYTGKFGYVAVKDACHVIVELVGIGAYVHGHNGLVEFVLAVGKFFFEEREVGNGAGVVKLHGVGVEAYEFHPSGNE